MEDLRADLSKLMQQVQQAGMGPAMEKLVAGGGGGGVPALGGASVAALMQAASHDTPGKHPDAASVRAALGVGLGRPFPKAPGAE